MVLRGLRQPNGRLGQEHAEQEWGLSKVQEPSQGQAAVQALEEG